MDEMTVAETAFYWDESLVESWAVGSVREMVARLEESRVVSMVVARASATAAASAT